jgi:hypothetical protein
MIQANELRLGNHIKYQDNFKFIVKLEDFSDLYLGEDNIKDYTPIPLTEQWLIDFGFENVSLGEWEKENILLDNEYTDKGIWNIVEESQCLTINVKHVHQLQNLYFALTGKELKKQ